MNILPLVSAFILIFAIGSYTFVHSYLSSIQEKNHFTGAVQVSHTYGRKSQTKAYRKIKGENLHPRNPTHGEKQQTPYHSPRKRFYPYKEAKLNICALTTENNPKLEHLFSELVDELYAFSPFANSEIGSLLLQLLKKNKEITSVDELIDHTPEEKRELVYRILKGTQNYELNKDRGYPPLGDFVRIGDKREAPIHLCHASHPLLCILLGQDIAQDISRKEKEKWEPEHKHIPLSKEELEQLLAKRGISFSTVEELLDFKKSKDVLEEDVVEVAGIKIRHRA